ncbi:hypothetical protein HYW17_05280 [Candidatus Uhrbacteria bacterium]|nr:hypothetical protein [Candidatus Uhrbacteria bacterium]
MNDTMNDTNPGAEALARDLRDIMGRDEIMRDALNELRFIRRWPAPREEVIQAVARATRETAGAEYTIAQAIVEDLIQKGALFVCEQPGDPLHPLTASLFEEVFQAGVSAPALAEAIRQGVRARKRGRPRKASEAAEGAAAAPTAKLVPQPGPRLADPQELPRIEHRVADAFTLVCEDLRKLAKSGEITWPLNGRDLAELIRTHVVAQSSDWISSETARIMRALQTQGILRENALGTDWYWPGPNFSAPQ